MDMRMESRVPTPMRSVRRLGYVLHVYTLAGEWGSAATFWLCIGLTSLGILALGSKKQSVQKRFKSGILESWNPRIVHLAPISQRHGPVAPCRCSLQASLRTRAPTSIPHSSSFASTSC